MSASETIIRENFKFNTSGIEGHGVKIIERIKLLPYHKEHGYRVKPCKRGNIWRVKMLAVGKAYKNAPTMDHLSTKIGMSGGVWYVSL